MGITNSNVLIGPNHHRWHSSNSTFFIVIDFNTTYNAPRKARVMSLGLYSKKISQCYNWSNIKIIIKSKNFSSLNNGITYIIYPYHSIKGITSKNTLSELNKYFFTHDCNFLIDNNFFKSKKLCTNGRSIFKHASYKPKKKNPLVFHIFFNR